MQKPEPAVQIETVLPESVIFTLDEVMILTQDVVIVADEVHLGGWKVLRVRFVLSCQKMI